MMVLSILRQSYKWGTEIARIEAGPGQITQVLPDGITASDLYDQEITRQVLSAGKYVYVEREYSLSSATAETRIVTEQTRISGVAYIILLSMLCTILIPSVWLDMSQPTAAHGVVFTLNFGTMVAFFLLSRTGLTENKEVVRDDQAGILMLHFLIVAIVAGAVMAVGLGFDQLSLLARTGGSLLVVATAAVIFTDVGQALHQRVVDYADGGFTNMGSFIPTIHFAFVLHSVPVTLLSTQILQIINSNFTAGARLGYDSPIRYPVFLFIMIVITMLVVAAPLFVITRLSSLYTQNQNTFTEDLPDVSDLQSGGIVAFTSLASIAVVVVGANYLLELLLILFQYEFHSTFYPVLLVLLSPLCIPLYFFIGGTYQLIGTVTQHVLMHKSSSLPAQSLPYEPDAEVRLLSTSSPLIFAKQIGGQQVVVVSEGLLQEVNQRTEDELSSSPALAALLAHEEGHVLHGDTALVSRLQVIGSLTFAPKNALYLIYNFRSREFKADDHAQEKTSAAALRSALNLMQDIQFNQEYMLPNVAGAAAAPIVRSASAINRMFGFLYGDFMLTEAHADFDERRDRLTE